MNIRVMSVDAKSKCNYCDEIIESSSTSLVPERCYHSMDEKDHRQIIQATATMITADHWQQMWHGSLLVMHMKASVVRYDPVMGAIGGYDWMYGWKGG